MQTQVEIPVRPKRRFLPEDLKIDSWEKVETFFIELRDREIKSALDLELWLHDRSEIESVLYEESSWRYIKMTCDTTSQKFLDSYNFFITEIDPRIAPFTDAFNKKLMNSPFLQELDKEKYQIYLRNVKKDSDIFSESNIPLFVEHETEAQKYAAISGAMTVNHGGREITMQKAASYLKKTDRKIREEIFYKIHERRGRDERTLNDLYSKLLAIRHQIALNTGFKNYRDYKHFALGRFDYTPMDCFNFHRSIADEITPMVRANDLLRREKFGYVSLKPWDIEADAEGKEPLKPFSNGEELINKTIQCFYKICPFFGERLEIMKAMKYLDLESRKGKAPGGYNSLLYEIGVPFIFMNSVGSMKDLVTMVHEGGHAIHSFLTRNLELAAFKEISSEVAELASMSMELISMEHWDIFFQNENDLKRAKRDHLNNILRMLTWIATIDKFQHWAHENPVHTIEERIKMWRRINEELGSDVVDWSENENILNRNWQGQLHLFSSPFYYIEYGIAQLGAIAVWRNYKKNPKKALDDYQNALSLGYTKSIPEIYKTAGVKFDFSRAYVKELAQFVKTELEKI